MTQELSKQILEQLHALELMIIPPRSWASGGGGGRNMLANTEVSSSTIELHFDTSEKNWSFPCRAEEYIDKYIKALEKAGATNIEKTDGANSKLADVKFSKGQQGYDYKPKLTATLTISEEMLQELKNAQAEITKARAEAGRT